MAGHRPHLAVLAGLDGGASAGLEPLHVRDPPAGLLPGLGVQRPERRLLHPLLPLCVFLRARWHHGLLLWQHPLHSENGKAADDVFIVLQERTPSALLE